MKDGDGKPDGSHTDKNIHLLAARLAKRRAYPRRRRGT